MCNLNFLFFTMRAYGRCLYMSVCVCSRYNIHYPVNRVRLFTVDRTYMVYRLVEIVRYLYQLL